MIVKYKQQGNWIQLRRLKPNPLNLTVNTVVGSDIAIIYNACLSGGRFLFAPNIPRLCQPKNIG